jgi:hypothetical protein
MKRHWPHVGFWIAFTLVLLNVFIALTAPIPELQLNALGSGGFCGLAALVFWIRVNEAER